jgi:hypothetical protein
LGDNLSQYTFSQSITNANILEANVIPSGVAALSGGSTYVGVQPVRSAMFAVSVEIFQSRIAAGGQIEGVDFTATPFRMGRSLFNRCVGLLGPYIDVESMAQ